MTGALRWLAVAPIVASAPAAADFAPRDGVAYRYDTAETRTVDGVTRHFHAQRSVVFRRVEAGYDVVVTLDAVDQRAGDAVGAMFEAATGALRGHPLRFHVDAAGNVTGVEDQAAAIALIADAIEHMTARAAPIAGRTDDSRALAAPLRALPPERQRAMLLSILAPLIDAARRVPGRRAVTLPSRPPAATDVPLAGAERITRDGEIVTIETTAAGGVAAQLPGDTPGTALTMPGAANAEEITIRRRIDQRTGLLIDSRETIAVRIFDGERVHDTRIETLITLSPNPLPGAR